MTKINWQQISRKAIVLIFLAMGHPASAADHLELQVQPVRYYKVQGQIFEGTAPMLVSKSLRPGRRAAPPQTIWGLRAIVSLVGTRVIERLSPETGRFPRAALGHAFQDPPYDEPTIFAPGNSFGDTPSFDFVQDIDKFYMPLPSEAGTLTVGPYSYRVDGRTLTTPAVILHSVRVNRHTVFFFEPDNFRVGQPANIEVYVPLQTYFPGLLTVTVADTAAPLQAGGGSMDQFMVYGRFTPTHSGMVKVKMLIGTDFGSFPIGTVP